MEGTYDKSQSCRAETACYLEDYPEVVGGQGDYDA